MTTRRHFIGLFPLAGATLLGACGGGGTSEAAEEPAAGNGSGTDMVPAFVVVEDWASGTAIDAGRIDFSTLIRDDTFADAALAADCLGWQELGPATITALPVLNRVQFSAKLFTIRAGGRYSQTSHRVLVMMRALDLGDGLFGDIRGATTFPGPHKLRITNAAGERLKTIEMRDGLPMNHASLVNVPFNWTVSDRPTALGLFPTVKYSGVRLPADKPMRPWMSAGSSYIAFFGSTPDSSAAVRDRIPRVRSDLWNGKATKVRSIYNGDDVHLHDPNYGGNGNGHPEVMPRWAMSQADIQALPTVVQNDPELTFGVQGYNWVNALRVGWDYEPGALGGITRRGGPGGVRMDRTILPNEIFQMALSQSTRTNDNASTAEMARGFALNNANYPGYYPRSMATLDAINHFDSTPQTAVADNAFAPVFHYYGTLTSQSSNAGAVWVGDQYGTGLGPIASIIEWANPGVGGASSTGNHPRNGWCPDSEHNNRAGTAWAVLLYADPLFSRMAEHMMMFESHLMSPVLSRANYNIFGSNIDLFLNDPSYFWSSRTNILPFCTSALMWWTATTNGVYTRAQIEDRFHAFFAKWKTEIRDAMPTTANARTASQAGFALTGGLQISWQSWPAGGNYSAGSGWVATLGIFTIYMGHFLTVLKASGLYEVLKRNNDTALCLGDLERQLEVNARLFADAPWAIASTGAFSTPYLVLRSTSQGAVQTDLTTVPSTMAQVLAYNPAPRTDAHWYLAPNAIPGTDQIAAVRPDGQFGFNYAGLSRHQTAYLWWDLFAAAGSERTAALTRMNSRIAALNSYTPFVYDAGFTRYNSIQTIPALSV